MIYSTTFLHIAYPLNLAAVEVSTAEELATRWQKITVDVAGWGLDLYFKIVCSAAVFWGVTIPLTQDE